MNHQSIDDTGTNARNFGSISHFYDQVTGYEFSVLRYNGSTYVSPRSAPPQRVELKIGILAPFHQQNDNWTRELTLSGTSAVRMAAAEINTKELIPGAYITLIEKDSFPKETKGQSAITEAVVATVSLVQQGVIGVIGDISSSWTALSALITSTLQIPQCSYTAVAASLSDRSQYGHFFRTSQTPQLSADAALSFVTSRGWPSIGMIYSNDDFGKQLSQYIIMKAKSQNVHIQTYQSFFDDNTSISQVAKDIDTFLSSGVRIVLVAAQGDAQITALTVAAHLGYMDQNHVWVIPSKLQDLNYAITNFNDILYRRHQGEQLNEAHHVGEQDVSQETLESNTASTTQEWVAPLDYLAWTTTNTTPISYNDTFSGGVFSFRKGMNLSGYPPFDQFLEKWSHLDPSLYPYGGTTHIGSHVGMAYSCMMSMALGFNQALHNKVSSNETAALYKLSRGKLGETLAPTSFNTGWEGPDGPIVFNQDGDRTTGNFRVYNLQAGSDVEIGLVFAGKLNLTSPPVYFGGSTKAPTGLPEKRSINPGYHTAISLIIIAFAFFGVFVALFSGISVFIHKRRHQTNVSTRLSCFLELTGFILLYLSAFFFSADRTRSDCFIIPVTFHLGLGLVLSCLSVKLYHVYQVHNNIYISGPVLSNKKLLRVCGCSLLVPMIVLIIWLPTTSVDIQTMSVPVTSSTYYIRCDYGTHYGLIGLISLVAASFLAMAISLAIRTRRVPRKSPKYKESKYIGLAIYNIFFSALIGFVVFRTATADYFTRHYISAAMIVWGSTISLLVLYLPKLHTIYIKDNPHARKSVGRLSNTSQLRWGNNNNNINNNRHHHFNNQQIQSNNHYNRSFNNTSPGEIISINRMINSSAGPFDVSNHHNGLSTSSRQRVHQRHKLTAGGPQHIDAEAYECQMPIQVVYRYLPHLSAWDMNHIVLFPRVGYFSFVSEKTHKGVVFNFKEASILSSFAGEYILKIHGVGHSDVLLQVARREDLDLWYERFNIYNRLQQCQQTAFYNSSADLPPSVQQLNQQHLINVPFGAMQQHQNNTMDTTTTMTSMLSSREYHNEDDDDDDISCGVLNKNIGGDHEDNEERKNKPKKSPVTITTTTINNIPTVDLLQDQMFNGGNITNELTPWSNSNTTHNHHNQQGEEQKALDHDNLIKRHNPFRK